MKRSLYSYTLLSAFLFGLFHTTAWGQQNFVTLKEGEYEIKKATEPQIKDAIISGRFATTYESEHSGTIGGRTGAGQSVYEFELGFRSNIHDYVSMNATLANFSDITGDQTTGYQSRYPLEEGDSTNDTGMNLIFKEAFLEYNHNPSAVLRIGRHKFNIGDRQGLVYKGIASGFSQTCNVGTWCYLIGSAKLGKGIDDNLMFAQLTYPVYESGKEVKDFFSNEFHQDNGLYIELFRNFYRGSQIPLAKYGGRTGNGSAYHATTDTGKKVYFDNKKIEYFGLNGTWYLPQFQFHLNYIANAGFRDYWAGNGLDDYLGHSHVTGHLWYSRNSYDWEENVRLSYDYFSATGNKDPSHAATLWKHDLTAYTEVQKGYFGDALIYFQGQQQTGQSHSVSNLSFQSTSLRYRSMNQPWQLDLSLYSFHKTNPVLDENNQLVQAIGREVDVLYSNQIEKNLTFKFGYAVFMPEAAFSRQDNETATQGKTFSSVSTQLNYHF